MSHLQRAGSLARIRHILDYFCEQMEVAMKKPLFTLFSICIVGLTACTTSPHPAAETALPLSPQQQANLRQLLGLTGSSPFTDSVLDTDHNGTLNVGDTLVQTGGIAVAEILRRPLTVADIQAIGKHRDTKPSGIACTMELKLCPNGSAVGRSGPQCQFAPCP